MSKVIDGVHYLDEECTKVDYENTDWNEVNLSDSWWTYNWLWEGIDSKFPLCCIFFFINVWTKNEFRHGQVDDGCKNWYDNADGYIRCPDCIAKVMGLGMYTEEEEELYLHPLLNANQETIPSSIYGVNDKEVLVDE